MPSSACRRLHLELQLLAQLLVERAERLVHQQQARLEDDGAGKRDALLLAARELARIARAVAAAGAPARAPRRPAWRARPWATPRCFSGKPMFSATRQVRKQRVVLEHHADVAPIGRHGDDRLAVDRDVAARSASRSRRSSSASWSCPSRSGPAASGTRPSGCRAIRRPTRGLTRS